jgi:hypothetical protein
LGNSRIDPREIRAQAARFGAATAAAGKNLFRDWLGGVFA